MPEAVGTDPSTSRKMAELEEVTLDGKPLQALRVTDLKAALEQRGLAKSGQKSALVKRLKGVRGRRRRRKGVSAAGSGPGRDESLARRRRSVPGSARAGEGAGRPARAGGRRGSRGGGGGASVPALTAAARAPPGGCALRSRSGSGSGSGSFLLPHPRLVCVCGLGACAAGRVKAHRSPRPAPPGAAGREGPPGRSPARPPARSVRRAWVPLGGMAGWRAGGGARKLVQAWPGSEMSAWLDSGVR